MPDKKAYLFKPILLVTDFFVINLAIIFWVLFSMIISSDFNGFSFLAFSLVATFSWFISAWFWDLYRKKTFNAVENILRQTYKTFLLQASLIVIVLLTTKITYHPLKWGIDYLLSLGILLTVSRFFLTYIVEFVIRKAKLQKKIAILGYNEVGVRLADYFRGQQTFYSFQGFFDNNENDYPINDNGKIVGTIDKCMYFVVKNNIREIYSTILPDQHDDMPKLIEIADQHCVRVKFVSGQPASPKPYFHHGFIDSFPVLSLRADPLDEMNNRVKKRMFDIIFSSLVIIFILSWLIPLVTLLIKLESKGPVFFRQLRSGRDNKPFWCYKFRSMKVNSYSDLLQAAKNDARVTRVGAFLRKTSLDELPQFFNVFAGDMTTVGPRPHMLKHTEQYSELINKFMVRHFVKQGITGWAQVEGYRGETKEAILMEKRVEHDIWYMENWSLMLDVKIIFMTIINLFKGDKKAF